MTIKEIAPLWFKDKGPYVKSSTMSAYNLLLQNYIIPTLGDKTPEEITNEVMNEYAAKLIDDGLSKKSSVDVCIVLKMILTYAMEKLGAPWVKYKITYPSKYATHREEIVVYTDAEYKQIISFVRNNMTTRRLGILLTLLTGMRIGEVCALRWKNVDIDNKLIKIRETVQRIYKIEDSNKRHTEVIFDRPKSSSSYRDVPIVKELLSILKHYKAIMNEDFFVVSGTENVCEPRTFRTYYQKFILDEVGLKRVIKFHGMRHSFASRLIANGVDVKTASRILGHANVGITMDLYVHPTMDNKLDAVNKSMKNLFK